MAIDDKKWCYQFFAIVIAFFLAFLSLNYYIDLYGYFGVNKSDNIQIYLNEYQSKFLLSHTYIPSHFDALLIGTSLTHSLDLKKIKKYKFYNLSLDAANIADEKILLENVINHGKIKLVVLVVQPFITQNHIPKVKNSDIKKITDLLFSIELMKNYKHYLIARLKTSNENLYDESGSYFKYGKNVGVDNSNRLKSFNIDAIAMKQYQQIITDCNKKGIKVIAYIPPLLYKDSDSKESEYNIYIKNVLRFFPENTAVINFDNDAYQATNKIKNNFYDGIHLSQEAADFYSKEFSKKIDSNEFN